jgi:hypothetical protein
MHVDDVRDAPQRVEGSKRESTLPSTFEAHQERQGKGKQNYFVDARLGDLQKVELPIHAWIKPRYLHDQEHRRTEQPEAGENTCDPKRPVRPAEPSNESHDIVAKTSKFERNLAQPRIRETLVDPSTKTVKRFQNGRGAQIGERTSSKLTVAHADKSLARNDAPHDLYNQGNHRQ